MKQIVCAVLVCLLWGAIPARSQTFVRAGQNATNAVTAITVTVAITSGDTAILFCGEGANNTSTATITDSASQSGWTQAVAGYSSGTGTTTIRAAWWYRTNSATLTTVTCTWSGSLSTRVDGIVYDVNGLATTSTEDTSINNLQNSSVTTATSGTFSTTNANDILLYGARLNGAYSAPTNGTGYTIPTNGSSVRAITEYQIVTATQSSKTASMTWTTAEAYNGAFLALKKAAGGGSTTDIPHQMMTGVGQ